MHAIGKSRVRRGLALILAAGALVVGAPTALAQTTTTPPYPGGTTTTQPAETSSSVNLGARGLGSRFTVSLCGFQVNSNVTMQTNNEPVPGDTADSNTCAQVTFEIQGGLAQALGVQRVGNMLAVTGLAQTRGNVVVVVNGKAVTIGPLGSVVTTVARGTGVNGAPRTVTVSFTVLRASQVDGQGGLARTGATILKWSPLGGGLLAVGYMLLLVSRRRRTATA
jgi:hypothetical protein